VKKVLDFGPFDRGLPPALKFLFEVGGGRLYGWILLGETPAQLLADEKYQSCQTGVFGQAYLERPP
jgi:hypothetical protein